MGHGDKEFLDDWIMILASLSVGYIAAILILNYFTSGLLS